MNRTKRTLKYAHLVGEGIGADFAQALARIQSAIVTIDFTPVFIHEFRDEDGNLKPGIIDILKECKIGMKGPLRTAVGTGAKSVTVFIRKALDLHANIRQISWIPGVTTPVLRPQDVNLTVIRQNTEDIYMGIEAKAGSLQAKQLFMLLRSMWKVDKNTLPPDDLTGASIKLISKPASEKIMLTAIMYAKAQGLDRICIVHKGNIMKMTEGAFKKWCMDYAIEHFRNEVYTEDEASSLTAEETSGRILIHSTIADDCFQQLLINPTKFQVIVTPNLNGDYLSDAAAAQVGGVPTAAGANIGDKHAIFEAIGGTADDIAGKNKANPTAFFLAFAMMLDHAGFSYEANAIRTAIAKLFEAQVGTADMRFEEAVSMMTFADKVSELIEEILQPVTA